MGIRTHDLAEIRDPYVALGFVVVAVLVIIALYKTAFSEGRGELIPAFLLKRP